jgi:hypothetical protein
MDLIAPWRLKGLICLFVVATACTSNATSPSSELGLRIPVPSGWHVRNFTQPATGIEIANFQPPPLVGNTGADPPLQASGTSFPPDGIALVVYEGSMGSQPFPLPLSESELGKGSCALGPCMEFASFTANGRTYVLNAKIGMKAWGTNYALLRQTIGAISVS